jgi:hypothetical protein
MPVRRIARTVATILCLLGAIALLLTTRHPLEEASTGVEPSTALASLSEPPTAVATPEVVDLPEEQIDPQFDFHAAGTDVSGSLLYDVRINGGGSPALVGLEKLTPLFNVDGKDGPQYVSDAFFAANPHRTPASIQPGDRFVLMLPAGTFVVRWMEERQEPFGGTATVREYVSDEGDRLLFYLTDRFPVRYEERSADAPNVGNLHLSSELPYLLQTGQTDVYRLAQAIYRVLDPDIYQMAKIRALIPQLRMGQESVLALDRSRAHLDPIRDDIPSAAESVPVADPKHPGMTRYAFTPNTGARDAAVEDALGSQTSLDGLPGGEIFRIQYGWDGVVTVSYKTGPDDARGKRDPYAAREDERWAKVFQELGIFEDPPVKWGKGVPSDLSPFPTARDPRQKGNGGEPSFDFLVPNRVIVLTFQPIRRASEVQAETQLRDGLRQMRDYLLGDNDSRGTGESSAAESEAADPAEP